MWVLGVFRGSWDLVTRVISKATILIAPIKVLITLLTKSHDPLSLSPEQSPRQESLQNPFVVSLSSFSRPP